MEKIGVIVGNGKLPLYFLDEAEEKKLEIYPIGLFDTIAPSSIMAVECMSFKAKPSYKSIY